VKPHLDRAAEISCVVLLMFAHACSSSTDDEAPTDSITQAITPDWSHPACDGSALMPPNSNPQMCNGPWVYDYREWWKDRTACGNSTHCNRYNGCVSWDRDTGGDGLGFRASSALSSQTTHQYYCPGGPNPGPCQGDFPAIVCPVDKESWRTQLIAARPGMSGPAQNAFTTQWGSTIISVEVDPEPPAGGGQHASTTTFACILSTSTYSEQLGVNDLRPACGCAEFEPNECLRAGPISVLTAPGVVVPGTPGTPLPGSTRREFVAPPQCTTCDVGAITNSTSAQNKFSCLDASLDNMSGLNGIPVVGPVTPTEVIASIAARMELMLQLAGDQLGIDQRTRAEEIYDEQPDATPACRAPIAWTPDCRTEATPFHLPGQLQLCQDLVANTNTTRTIAGLELSHCLSQLSGVDQLTTTGCRLATRDTADTAAQGVLARAQPDYTGNLATALPDALSRINSWWAAAQVAARGDTSWIVEHSSGITRTLWQSLELARLPHAAGSPPGLPHSGITDAQAIALLADVTNTGLEDDIAVLTAVFADAENGTSPVLLTLTGDALRSINDRLSHLKPIADIACRFLPCKADGVALRSSAVSELVHALSVLPDPTKLGPVLASASKLQQQQAPLHAVLGQLQAHHSRLSSAWTALGRTDSFTALGKVIEPPAEAAMLAKIVREASIAWSSYESTGEFDPGHRPRLTAATLEQGTVIANIDSLVAGVNNARTAFSNSRLNTVNDLLLQVQNSQTAQSLHNRNTLLHTQYNDVFARSLGLGNAEAQARMTMAQFQKAFETIAGALAPSAVFHAQPLETLQATAADAKYPINAPQNNVGRDHFHVETLQPGEALRLHVTGAWAPTCAISKAMLKNPDDGTLVKITVPSNAATGPTGYWASFETNTYKAHTENNQWLQRLDVGAGIEVCGGFEVLGSGGQTCAHLNLDEMWENTIGDSDGDQTRASASFAVGIRLPFTPYPVAPAGSLVAVLTRTHSPNNVIDVQIVESEDLIIAPALPPGVDDTVDVHLVVNDALAGCTQDTTDRLTIEMVRTTPIGNIAQALGKAMSNTLATLEAEVPGILAQGQLTPAQATELRSGAWLEVQTELPAGLGLSGLPSDLHQLFEAFLDLEINSISRRGDMHALALQSEQLLIEFAANADELHFNDQRSQLSFLIPRWRLRDLEGGDLSLTIGALAQSLTAYVAPIFELRAPAQYTSFPALIQDQLNSLIDLPITGTLEDQVGNLTAFAGTLREALAAAPIELPDVDRHVLVAAIPRPPTHDIPNPQSPPWHQVTDATATAFWSSAIDSNDHLLHSAKLTLSPRDLYVFGGNPGTLACADTESDVAPVIRRMAIYLDTQSPPNGQLGASLPTRAAGFADVTFPLVGRLMTLAPDDPRGIPLSLPVLAGGADVAIDRFSPPGVPDPGLGVGAGLSPFTSFEIDMTSLGNLPAPDVFKMTQAIYVMFEVEARQSLDPPSVEGVCVMQQPDGSGGPAGGDGGGGPAGGGGGGGT
jgi:hypothetical protein